MIGKKGCKGGGTIQRRNEPSCTTLKNVSAVGTYHGNGLVEKKRNLLIHRGEPN